jgi:hypothetical protein
MRQDRKTPFGESVVAELTPEVQVAATYNLIDSQLETFDATGGSTDTDANLFRCQSGTSVGGYGVIRTKKTTIYHPGEGVLGRLTASFTAGVPLPRDAFILDYQIIAIGYQAGGLECGLIAA